MATTTPNFGWDIPQSTDLVKDGATAIAALGTDIDTALVDLKGGTTGQVLSKNSNTDLDFTWVAQDDTNAIQNTIVDAKGDLITATAADVPARLASSGVNGDVLTIDTSTSTGLKWATPAAGGMSANLTLLNTGGTDLTGAGSVTINVSSYDRYYIYIQQASFATGDITANLRINGDTTNKYAFIAFGFYGTGLHRDWYTLNQTSRMIIGNQGSAAGDEMYMVINITGGKSSVIKTIDAVTSAGGSSTQINGQFSGNYTGSADITSLTFYTASATNWDNGKVFVYGA